MTLNWGGDEIDTGSAMDHFAEKLRLREMAEEDIYFAKQDLELVKALHRKRLAKHAQCDGFSEKKKARDFEVRYAALTNGHRTVRRKPKRLELLQGLRELLDDVSHACRHRY